MVARLLLRPLIAWEGPAASHQASLQRQLNCWIRYERSEIRVISTTVQIREYLIYLQRRLLLASATNGSP